MLATAALFAFLMGHSVFMLLWGEDSNSFLWIQQTRLSQDRSSCLFAGFLQLDISFPGYMQTVPNQCIRMQTVLAVLQANTTKSMVFLVNIYKHREWSKEKSCDFQKCYTHLDLQRPVSVGKKTTKVANFRCLNFKTSALVYKELYIWTCTIASSWISESL